MLSKGIDMTQYEMAITSIVIVRTKREKAMTKLEMVLTKTELAMTKSETVNTPTGVYMLGFFCSSIQFNVLLSPYLCII